jgi:hypothetical protein
MFDNRVSLDRSNLSRIIADHADRAALVRHVRRTAALLWDVADSRSDLAARVRVPSLLVSNDAVVVDQPLTVADLVNGLAADHGPRHTEQLLASSVAG